MVAKIDEKMDYKGIPTEYTNSTFGEKVAINFYGTKPLPFQFKKNWVIQLYVIDLGTECNIFLVAVGSSSLQRVWNGKSQSIDFQYSIEKRNELVDMLNEINR